MPSQSNSSVEGYSSQEARNGHSPDTTAPSLPYLPPMDLRCQQPISVNEKEMKNEAQSEEKTSKDLNSEDPNHKRYRTAFSREQVAQLEKEFQRENYVSRPHRCKLAAALNLPESTIKVWFQNRRMKDKRQRMALYWPYADPQFAAYVLQAVAANRSYPYPANSAPIDYCTNNYGYNRHQPYSLPIPSHNTSYPPNYFQPIKPEPLSNVFHSQQSLRVPPTMPPSSNANSHVTLCSDPHVQQNVQNYSDSLCRYNVYPSYPHHGSTSNTTPLKCTNIPEMNKKHTLFQPYKMNMFN